ncbi:MAG TPA: hypothetical protein VIV11_34810 [Kofleriaceae bacterium]
MEDEPYAGPKPSDAEVEALIAGAKATRKRPSRGLWFAALIVSVACVIGLAYGLITNWDAKPEVVKSDAVRASSSSGSGFGLGLVIGLGAGIAIGSVLALRKRHS